MLTKVQIEGFQTHDRLRLKLGPGVTTIVGRSDVGKSSVCRALRWLALGAPPKGMLRHGAKRVRVSVEVDGHRLTRTRTSTENSYTLDGKQYKALGATVPPEVVALLGVGPANFQRQLDGPFWFDMSGGEVSRELNAIVNLGDIDAALSHLAAQHRKATTSVEVCEDRLRAASARVVALNYVPDADDQLRAVEALTADAHDKAARAAAVASLLRQAQTAANTRKRAAAAAIAARYAEATARKAASHRLELERLAGLLDDITALAQEAADTRTRLTDVQTQLKKAIGDTCPLCGQRTS